MAKTRLKVFRTQAGFVDAIVAAPSQAAALKAWGVEQNLFAEKMAAVTDEDAAVRAALAKPGVVLQRPLNGEGAFTQTPALSQRNERSSLSPTAPRPPDRKALGAAEKALADIEAQASRERAQIAKARKDLDAREAAATRQLHTKREAAERKLERERQAYRRRGGHP